MTLNVSKLGKYIRQNHLDLVTVLAAVIACWLTYEGVKLARETIKLTNESAVDTAKQIKASQEQLKASQQQLKASEDQLDLFRKNLDIAREQLDSFRQYERETFAKPDFTIRFDVTPFTQNVRTPQKAFGRFVAESFVEYGKVSFVSATIQNTGAAPARNVSFALTVTDMKAFDQLGDEITQFQPVARPLFPGDPRGTIIAHYPVMHRKEKTWFVFPVKVKTDATDGAAQFFVNIEGDNLKQHYYQGLILRRSPKPAEPRTGITQKQEPGK